MLEKFERNSIKKIRIDQKLACVLRNFIPGNFFPIEGGGVLKVFSKVY